MTRRPARLALLTTTFALAVAATPFAQPAAAVVGGTPVAAGTAPWFATLQGLCGGVLVAPDRVATAAHCVEGLAASDLPAIRAGGAVRRAVRVAQPPGWRTRRNVETPLDDVALLRLDRAVTTARPVTLARPGEPVPATLRLLGRGLTRAPSPGGGSGNGGLREATLRTLTDADCARRYRVRRGNDGERFSAAEMLCALDADGRAPLSSACIGDSGGPMVAGPPERPVLFGLVSWGGDGCGADRLPTVDAEVARYAAFLAAPAPVWAPVPSGPARPRGVARAGGTLRCEVAPWTEAPQGTSITWLRDAEGFAEQRARGATLRLTRRDRGTRIGCRATGETAGGRADTPVLRDAFVRVAR